MKNSLLGVVFVAAMAAAQAPTGESAPNGGEIFQETPPPQVELTLPSDSGEAPRPETAPATPEGPEQRAEEGVDAGEPIPEDSLIRGVNEVLDERDGGESAAGMESPLEEPRRATGFFYYLRVFSSLCLVIALILFVGYFARKLGKRTPLLAGGQLGSVLGRIQLSRGASLHFVRSGGRVLVVGVTATNTSLVAEFDASAFLGEGEETSAPEHGVGPNSFRAQLQASSKSMTQNAADHVEDDEIVSLRGDIQRLQQYLREESRELRQ